MASAGGCASNVTWTWRRTSASALTLTLTLCLRSYGALRFTAIAHNNAHHYPFRTHRVRVCGACACACVSLCTLVCLFVRARRPIQKKWPLQKFKIQQREMPQPQHTQHAHSTARDRDTVCQRAAAAKVQHSITAHSTGAARANSSSLCAERAAEARSSFYV